MRIILATLWLLVPLGFAAYHYGPGQEQVKLDHTEVFLAQARAAVQDKNWNSAIESYQKALAKLPKENKETSMRIQLEIAKAKMQNSGLPEAREDLAELVSQLNEDTTISSELQTWYSSIPENPTAVLLETKVCKSAGNDLSA